MRISYLLTLFVVLLVLVGIGVGAGVALGLFTTTSSTTDSGDTSEAPADKRMPELPPRGGPQPHVMVDAFEFDFGEMERFAKGRRKFVFSNTGKYPLKLAVGDTTCKCTLSELAKKEVPPGESADVFLEWEARSEEEQFRQSATIFTNDPNQRSVTLTVTGRLIQSLTLAPPEVVFSNATPDSHIEGKARLLVQTTQPVKITGHSLEDPATARFFDVSYSPLAAGEVPPGYKSGWQIVVALKPGLPFGAIQQKIRLRTDLPESPEQEIRVLGNVSNGVSILGTGWLAEHGVLRLDVIKKRAGTTRNLQLLVKGPHRKEANFRLLSVKPDFVKATLGEPKVRESVTHVQLVIEIPGGSPAVNCLGGPQGPMGEVLLDSGQPDIGQVRLKLQFAVVEG